MWLDYGGIYIYVADVGVPQPSEIEILIKGSPIKSKFINFPFLYILLFVGNCPCQTLHISIHILYEVAHMYIQHKPNILMKR